MAERRSRSRASPVWEGGFDTDLSVDQLQDTLKCSICTGILRDPVMVNQHKCGHTYCRTCIEKVREHQSVCPDCRAPILEDGGVSPAPPVFKRTVNEIPIRCKYAYFKAVDFPGEGPCNWRGDLGSFDEPVNEKCEFGEGLCPQGCKKFVVRSKTNLHVQNDCMQTEVVCMIPGCNVKSKRCNMGQHMLDLSESHFASLLGIVMSLQGKDAERQAAITALEGKEAALTASVENLQETVADLRTEITDLSTRVKELTAAVAKNEESSTSLQEKAKEQDRNHQMLTARVEELTATVEKNEKSSISLREKTKKEQDRNHQVLTASVKELTDKVEKNEKSCAALEEKTQEQDRNHQMLTDTVNTQQVAITTSKERVTACEQKQARPIPAVEALQRQLGEHKDKLENLTKRTGPVATQRSAIAELKGKLETYEQKERDHIQKEKELEADVEAMKHGLDDLLTFSPSTFIPHQLSRATATAGFTFAVNPGPGCISANGKVLTHTPTSRWFVGTSPLEHRIKNPLKNGDVLELVMVNAPFDLTSVVFVCEVGGVPREELKVDSPKVQDKVRLMLRKDGVLAAIRCGDAKAVIAKGSYLERSIGIKVVFNFYGSGTYKFRLS